MLLKDRAIWTSYIIIYNHSPTQTNINNKYPVFPSCHSIHQKLPWKTPTILSLSALKTPIIFSWYSYIYIHIIWYYKYIYIYIYIYNDDDDDDDDDDDVCFPPASRHRPGRPRYAKPKPSWPSLTACHAHDGVMECDIYSIHRKSMVKP